MKRIGYCAVAAAIVLAGCTVDSPDPQPSGRSTPTTVPSAAGPGSSTSTTPTGTSQSAVAAPAQQAARGKQGLGQLLADNPLRGKQLQSLTKCPFGSVRSASRKVDAAGADTSNYALAYAIVQKYKVRRANDGVIGDSGLAISCTASTKSNATVLGLSASTNSTPTPEGSISGLVGPTPYRAGEAYTRAPGNLCYVYWVPPKRDYVLTVVARLGSQPNDTRCRAVFTAVAPTMISSLAALRD